jgi:hypothetical protein
LRQGDGVKIDDAINAVVRFLQLDEFDKGAKIISKMQIACRLNAGKNPFDKFCHMGETPKTLLARLSSRTEHAASACARANALRPEYS